MTAKFQVGDKVRFNREAHRRHQVPENVSRDLRRRTRTVIAATYCKRRRRTFYELGGPGKSRLGYCFTSHQLVHAEDTDHIGPPHSQTPLRTVTSTTDGVQAKAVDRDGTRPKTALSPIRVRLFDCVARAFGGWF